MPHADAWTTVTIDRETLVERLRDPNDQDAWRLVQDRYGPVLLAFARRLGIPAGWTEDACQDAMAAFCEAIRGGRFERFRNEKRQRLRDFLFGIARNKFLDLRRQRAREPVQVTGEPGQTSFFERLPAEDDLQRAWDLEWDIAVRAQCLAEAREKFSPTTYRIFHMRIIENRSSAEVAGIVGKNVNAVDLAVHHVRTFLRQIRPEVEARF